MQEEVESKSITLAISTTKLTARVLKEAMSKYLAYRKEKKREKRVSGPVKPMGKQTVKQLVGQNQGVSNIEITDSNIKASAFFFCFSQLSKLSIIASEGCAAA